MASCIYFPYTGMFSMRRNAVLTIIKVNDYTPQNNLHIQGKLFLNWVSKSWL